MTTRADTRRYSPEELLAMSDGDRYELADGRLVERTGGRHAAPVGGRLHAALARFLSGKRLGRLFAGAEVSYELSPDRPTLRRPAVSFVANKRVPKGAKGRLPFAPDLAAEVVSAEDSYEDLAGKVDEYLLAGTRLVWLLRPEARVVRVYRADGTFATLDEEGHLEGEEVLPGFRLTVLDLFPRATAPARGRSERAPVLAGKDGTALATAVRAEPAEDLPRLAYADWCEENGDPDYDSFIRAQVELARRPWDDPERPQLLGLEARSRPAALARYRHIQRGLSFERGFPGADLHAPHLADVGTTLHQAGPVLHIQLSSVKSRTREAAACPALEGLPSLSLESNALTGEGMITILQSPHLRDLAALDLTSTSLGPMAIREMAALRWPRLRKLVVARNRGRSQLLQALARAPWLGQLTELDLSGNYFGEAELAALVQAGDLGRLEALDLSALYFQEVNADAFARFLSHARLGRLRRLVLGRLSLRASHLSALASAPSLAELGELSLVHTGLTSDAITALASAPHLGRLATLDLTGSILDDWALRALAEARGLPALTTLRLGAQWHHYQGQATPAGLAELLRSPFVGRLRRLVVSWQQLAEGLVPALLSSPHLAGLVELDLTGCGLPAPALRALAEGPGLSGLRILRLANNTIDDDLARALLRSRPDLRELALGTYLQLSDQAREALRERFGAGVA
jgi:uncharacterized protein (TIGR02996 family)